MAVVAVLVANGFEQAEMTAICRDLAAAGHGLRILSTKKHAARSWDNMRWNGDLPVDVAAVDAKAADFDAMVVPGGVLASDTLRSDSHVIELAREMAAQGKPVALLGHGLWLAIEAGLVAGRQVTSHPALRTDLANAGATWVDQGAVRDGPLVSGRHGHDVGEFTALLADALA